MPLPDNNTPWPPAPLATVRPSMDKWSAWYAGDPALLEQVYLDARYNDPRATTIRPYDRPSTYRGGIVGMVARTFWGAPRGNLAEQPKQKLHVPIAADLCQASADLLFSEPPTITADDTAVNDRLGELVSDGMLSTFAEAAELGAALGGTYLRVTWDRDLDDTAPFVTTVDPDGAWPEFRWGRLTAVTFWTVVRRTQDGRVWRHLERHELDSGGVGILLHGLYEGREDNLGRPVPLTEDAATTALKDQVVDGNRISTESPGLAVTYLPHLRPQRRWRTDPVGRNLGRSALDGVEGLMDALDETYSSWMRDVRLGKARVFVARSMLEGTGPGQGAMWDSDREVYAPLEMLAPRESSGLPIQAEQFKIRFEEHLQTAGELIQSILRTAGYSAQTFGLGGGRLRSDATATEVQSRERRSYMTRDRMVRIWRPGLGDFLEKFLAVDAAVFGSGVTPQRPAVQFGDAVQESLLSLAQSALALANAKAASTKTLVELIHPDWDDDQITEEVQAIHTEDAAAMPALPDPTQITGDIPATTDTPPGPPA